jgi:undecaprenyl-diphosphatase
MGLKWILIAWAIIMIYTRVYLGVHYPGDILGGAIWGTLLGVVFGTTTNKLGNWLASRKEQPTANGQ